MRAKEEGECIAHDYIHRRLSITYLLTDRINLFIQMSDYMS